jgi:hypothetical protein
MVAYCGTVQGGPASVVSGPDASCAQRLMDVGCVRSRAELADAPSSLLITHPYNVQQRHSIYGTSTVLDHGPVPVNA